MRWGAIDSHSDPALVFMPEPAMLMDLGVLKSSFQKHSLEEQGRETAAVVTTSETFEFETGILKEHHTVSQAEAS